MLYFALFKCLWNHFVLVSEPKINLNFYKYNAITRIDSSRNTKFYAYYFGNYDRLRKDFDQKNRAVLHIKLDLNLHLVKRISRAVNVLNISETQTYWINLVGLLIAKVFLKHKINSLFTYSLYSSFYHFLHYIGPKKFSHHSRIRLCNTSEFFLIK